MFERFTERARRVIFFARYEASQFGSTTIESEHLLLGLVHEDRNIINRFHDQSLSSESIRAQITARVPIHEKVQQMAVGRISQVFLKTDCVPDDLTAMRIAEAVWLPVYGHETVNAQKPFTADLESDVWTVKGSPPAHNAAGAFADCTWLLDIGDRRMRIGNVRKPASDFLCETTSDRDLARFGSLNTAILRDRILDKPEKPA